MRRIPLSPAVPFIEYNPHASLAVGWDMNRHVYPSAIAVRQVADGEPIYQSDGGGATVLAWRWQIKCLGTLNLIVAVNQDGADLGSCDYLTPDPTVIESIDDVLMAAVMAGTIPSVAATGMHLRTLDVIGDTARCALWAWMSQRSREITGYAYRWYEHLTDMVIVADRYALPIGFTGQNDDLRRPLPVEVF